MIRNNLKSIRHTYEMNQTEFARLLGMSQSQYNRYEKGRRPPTLEVALRISTKLSRPVNDIFFISDESNASE